MLLSSPPIADALHAVRSEIDSALSGYLDELQSRCPDRLLSAMRYALLAPGKRLRPALVLWGAAACGSSDSSAAIPAAAAVEMIHAYSLIHDDLPAMDNDDLRRGRPTVHKQFDEATAILAGDALLTLAFEILARDLRPAHVAARCCATLAGAAGTLGMVGGQAHDLAAEGRYPDEPGPPPTLAGLQSIHHRKTGAMIRASLVMGGLVGDANVLFLNALQDFGDKIGLAFQITDDLLDVEGTEIETGKRVGKDHGLGKMTYPALCGIPESRRMATDLIDQAIAALQPFGNGAEKLEALARYVVERKH